MDMYFNQTEYITEFYILYNKYKPLLFEMWISLFAKEKRGFHINIHNLQHFKNYVFYNIVSIK